MDDDGEDKSPQQGAYCATCKKWYAQEELRFSMGKSNAGDKASIDLYKDPAGHTLKIGPAGVPFFSDERF